MNEIDVKVSNVTKKFGNFTAVNNVSFEVPRGSFFSILGPSGSGKTTLLRMISGFEQPDSGSIYIRGQLANDIPPNKRSTNLVFQNLALFPTMSVSKNIAFGLKRQHLSKEEIKKRVNRVLDLVDMKGMGEKNVNKLSGGQKQRVALARCLVLEPTVLLLDEPLGALDLKLRENMKLVLKRLQARVGTTFIYVTHDQSEALTMSNLVAVMNKGRIEQISPPLELFYNPKTYFVAKFIGDNNCWDGEVVSINNNECKVKISRYLIGAKQGENLKVGDKVSVFVRPEIIRLTKNNDKDLITGKVKEFVFDGAYFRILIEAGEKDNPVEIKVKIPQGEEIPKINIGEKVSLNWPDNASIAFKKKAFDETINGDEGVSL